VLYTAYFDEADTHGSAPTVIMASFLGSARQWELLGRRLGGLQHRYGFTIFHATEFKNKTGEFAGWSDTKCMDLVYDLTVLVRDNLTEGVTIHLERLRYEEEYRKPPVPKRMRLDSQYGVCFRACIAHLIAIILRDGKKHLLDVLIEDGHKNVGDTVRIFEDIKALTRRRLNTEVLRNIRVVKKQEAAPVMLADFMAYTYSRMRASKVSGGLDYDEEAPMVPRKREAGLTHLELLPEALRGLKETFERERGEAAEAWRARRDARKAGSAVAGKEQ
jgi:hypothetical protein